MLMTSLISLPSGTYNFWRLRVFQESVLAFCLHFENLLIVSKRFFIQVMHDPSRITQRKFPGQKSWLAMSSLVPINNLNLTEMPMS